MSGANRRAQIREVMQDPPPVHAGAPGGAWSSDAGCYEFLGDCCTAGSTTLETGLGVSTVLFTLWGANHTCITPSEAEARALLDYLRDREVPRDRLRLEVEYSDATLPRLDLAPLDVVLIDGCHGFPSPVLDWYYGCRTLKRGGVVVIDDIQLPHVAEPLCRFLDSDPRWRRLQRTTKWAAYRKDADFDLREEWDAQPFFRSRVLNLAPLGTAGRRRIRALAGRTLRRIGASRRTR